MENQVLKIKAYSLAEEARYIRKIENKVKAQARWNLHNQDKTEADVLYNGYESLRAHRLMLRKKMRATHLARAYLKNVPYITVEQKTNLGPYEFNSLVMEVAQEVASYGMLPFGKSHGGYPKKDELKIKATAAVIKEWMMLADPLS